MVRPCVPEGRPRRPRARGCPWPRHRRPSAVDRLSPRARASQPARVRDDDDLRRGVPRDPALHRRAPLQPPARRRAFLDGGRRPRGDGRRVHAAPAPPAGGPGGPRSGRARERPGRVPLHRQHLAHPQCCAEAGGRGEPGSAARSTPTAPLVASAKAWVTKGYSPASRSRVSKIAPPPTGTSSVSMPRSGVVVEPSMNTCEKIPPTTWNDEIRFGPAFTTYIRTSSLGRTSSGCSAYCDARPLTTTWSGASPSIRFQSIE